MLWSIRDGLVDQRAQFLAVGIAGGWQQLCQEEGLEFTEEQFVDTFGHTSREVISRLWGNRYRQLEQVRVLDDRKEALYRDILQQNFPHIDGAADWARLINRTHNHAELKDGRWIHRKGATHAEAGMAGVIPGNMRDGSFIVEGRGNPDALWSSSHGAAAFIPGDIVSPVAIISGSSTKITPI